MQVRSTAFAILSVLCLATLGPHTSVADVDPEPVPSCVFLDVTQQSDYLLLYPYLGSAIGLRAQHNVKDGMQATLYVVPALCTADQLLTSGPVSSLFTTGWSTVQDPTNPPILPLP